MTSAIIFLIALFFATLLRGSSFGRARRSRLGRSEPPLEFQQQGDYSGALQAVELQDMTIRFEPFRSDHVSIVLQNPAPGILASRVSGHLDLAGAKCLMAAFDQVAASHRPVEVFHDWRGVEGYDSDAREIYTRWSAAHRGDVVRVHILFRSKLVAMAVSVARIKLPYLEAYTNEKVFLDQKQAAIWKKLGTSSPDSAPSPSHSGDSR